MINREKVFNRLQSTCLRHLFQRSVKFLGHIISEKGITTNPEKTKSISSWLVPTNASELRSFIGLCGYYRKFIKDFAKIVKYLHKLTAKWRPFVWSNECQDTFDMLRPMLMSSSALGHPDFPKEFLSDTDASKDSIGGVLSQEQKGHEVVIAFARRMLSKSERSYCVIRKAILSRLSDILRNTISN